MTTQDVIAVGQSAFQSRPMASVSGFRRLHKPSSSRSAKAQQRILWEKPIEVMDWSTEVEGNNGGNWKLPACPPRKHAGAGDPPQLKMVSFRMRFPESQSHPRGVACHSPLIHTAMHWFDPSQPSVPCVEHFDNIQGLLTGIAREKPLKFFDPNKLIQADIKLIA